MDGIKNRLYIDINVNIRLLFDLTTFIIKYALLLTILTYFIVLLYANYYL